MVTGQAHVQCLAVLQDASATAAERTTCASLLAAMAMHPDAQESVTKAKAAGRTGPQILLDAALMPDSQHNLRVSAAAALVQLTTSHDGAARCMAAFQQVLPWDILRGEFETGARAPYVCGQLATFLRNVMQDVCVSSL
jgi:hypothetical protein